MAAVSRRPIASAICCEISSGPCTNLSRISYAAGPTPAAIRRSLRSRLVRGDRSLSEAISSSAASCLLPPASRLQTPAQQHCSDREACPDRREQDQIALLQPPVLDRVR